MKYLSHDCKLACATCGAEVILKSPCVKSTINGKRIVVEDDLKYASAPSTCPQTGPGLKKCTGINSILVGYAQDVKIQGKRPLLSTTLALTDGLPPALVRVQDDGGSVMKVVVPALGMDATVGQASLVGETERPHKPSSHDEASLSFQIIDTKGISLKGKWYRVVLSDGTSQHGVLEENGVATLKNMKPGECVVQFPLMESVHSVSDGDNLQKLAETYYCNQGDWTRIRDHPRNQHFLESDGKKQRRLSVGDCVHVPSPICFKANATLSGGESYLWKVASPTGQAHLAYQQPDGSPVAGAKYVLISRDQKTRIEGDLDQAGQCTINDLALDDEYRFYFHDDPGEFQPSEDPKARNQGTSTADDIIDWLWGFAQGDFNKDQSSSQLTANVVLGLIPVVDQILDIRDLTAALRDLILYYSEDDGETSGRKKKAEKDGLLGLSDEMWLWLFLFISAIGAIPILGSALKGVLKGLIMRLRGLGKGAGDLSARQLERLWSETIDLLNNFDQGKNAHRWLVKQCDNMNNHIEEAAKIIKNSLEIIEKAIGDCEATIKKFDQLLSNERFRYLQSRLENLRKPIARVYKNLERAKAEINEWIGKQFKCLLQGKHVEPERAILNSESPNFIKQRAKGAVQASTLDEEANFHKLGWFSKLEWEGPYKVTDVTKEFLRDRKNLADLAMRAAGKRSKDEELFSTGCYVFTRGDPTIPLRESEVLYVGRAVRRDVTARLDEYRWLWNPNSRRNINKVRDAEYFLKKDIDRSLESGDLADAVYLRWTRHYEPKGIEAELYSGLNPRYNQKEEYEFLIDLEADPTGPSMNQE